MRRTNEKVAAVWLASILVILLCGCGSGSDKIEIEESGMGSIRLEKTSQDETSQSGTTEETLEETVQQTPEPTPPPKVIWTKFEKIDMAACAVLLHEDNAETTGCQILDLNADGSEELVYLRMNPDNQVRQEVFVIDLNNEPHISYLTDESPNGVETIGIGDGNKAVFHVRHVSADYFAEELYLWERGWKLADKTENVSIEVPIKKEIENQYEDIKTIRVENGDYEEIVKRYQSHLEELGVIYKAETSEEQKNTVFTVENYTAPWKEGFSISEVRDWGVFSTIRRDLLVTVEITQDETGCVTLDVNVGTGRVIPTERTMQLQEMLLDYDFYTPSEMAFCCTKYHFETDGTVRISTVGINDDEWDEHACSYYLEGDELFLVYEDGISGYFYNEELGIFQTEIETVIMGEEYGNEEFPFVNYFAPYKGAIDLDAYDYLFSLHPLYQE